MFKAFLRTDNSPAQLFIRIALGAVILPHGAQKVLGWFGGQGIEKTLQAFAAMGFPTWAAGCLMVVETLGAVPHLRFYAVWARHRVGISTHVPSHLQHGFLNWFGAQGERICTIFLS
jgi:putative oxidoreductase